MINISGGLLWHILNHGFFPVTEQKHCHESNETLAWQVVTVALRCSKKLISVIQALFLFSMLAQLVMIQLVKMH